MLRNYVGLHRIQFGLRIVGFVRFLAVEFVQSPVHHFQLLVFVRVKIDLDLYAVHVEEFFSCGSDWVHVVERSGSLGHDAFGPPFVPVDSCIAIDLASYLFSVGLEHRAIKQLLRRYPARG